MKPQKLPQTDSIQGLAQFWDSHDLADFEQEFEEAAAPIFERATTDAPYAMIPNRAFRLDRSSRPSDDDRRPYPSSKS